MAPTESRARLAASVHPPDTDDASPRTFVEELHESFMWVCGIFFGLVVSITLFLHDQVAYSLVAITVLTLVSYLGLKKYRNYKRPDILERRRWTDWAIAWGILGAFSFPILCLFLLGADLPLTLAYTSYAIAIPLLVLSYKRNQKEKELIRAIEVAVEHKRREVVEQRRQEQARAEAERQRVETLRKAEDEARKRQDEARKEAEEAKRRAATERERQERRALMTSHPTEILERIRAWDPDDVERLVAALWDSTPGFLRVHKTPKGPDSGIDVHAEWTDDAGKCTRIGIQVKRQKHPIGRREIQFFRGSLPSGGRGIFVTTGVFNDNARRDAQQADKPGGRIELVDGVGLAGRPG